MACEFHLLRGYFVKRPTKLLFLLLALVAIAAAGPTAIEAQSGDTAAAVAAKQAPIPTPAEGICPVADVRPGMTGYGLTVFNGFEPQRFNVRVLAVLKNYLAPGRDVLLMRCTDVCDGNGNALYDVNRDGTVNEYDKILERGAVSSGMSGSPVYLKCADGKYRIAGAVSLGWGLGTDPVGGVTPIEYMISDMNTPREEPIESADAFRPKYRPAAETLDATDPAERYRADLRYLATPMCISGVNPTAFAVIQKDLAARNMRAVQAGGSGGTPTAAEKAATMKPGSAVGVCLMRGDMEIYAYGTVTDVVGKKFMAFGHSYGDMGECKLPAFLGRVDHIHSSIQSSFKLASVIREVGSFTQDRVTSFSGRIDEKPQVRWIPVAIKVADKKTRQDGKSDYATFKMEVVDREDDVPTMVHYAVLSTIFGHVFTPGEYSAWMTTTVKFKGYEPIVLRNAFSNFGDNRPDFYYNSPADVIATIMFNPFEKVELESVESTIDYTAKFSAAWITGIKAEQETVAPGEKVTLAVKMRTWRSKEWTERIEVKVPEDYDGNAITLQVSGGALADNYVESNSENLADFIRIINDSSREDGLYVTYDRKTERVLYNGKYHDDLPPSVVEQLKRTAPEKISVGTETVVLKKIAFKHLVDDYRYITIKINRKEKK